jgi:hypothetical protein
MRSVVDKTLKRRALWLSLVAVVVVTGTALGLGLAGTEGRSGAGKLSADKALLNGGAESQLGVILPPQLPSADGFVSSSTSAASNSWTPVISSSAELSGTDAALPVGSTPGQSIQSNLIGGLSQVWVPQSAVNQFGQQGGGLQLPIPLVFAQANPGPIELDLSTFEFSNQPSAAALFDNSDYSHADQSPSAVIALTGDVPFGGRVMSINSLANGGLAEYQFQWVDGNYCVEFSVLGYNMPLGQAEALAAQVAV